MEIVEFYSTISIYNAHEIYPKPYIFGTLFSEELLQRRDVVSLSF